MSLYSVSRVMAGTNADSNVHADTSLFTRNKKKTPKKKPNNHSLTELKTYGAQEHQNKATDSNGGPSVLTQILLTEHTSSWN